MGAFQAKELRGACHLERGAENLEKLCDIDGLRIFGLAGMIGSTSIEWRLHALDA
jgi:hypothetical protein